MSNKNECIFKSGFLIEYKVVKKLKDSSNGTIYLVQDEMGDEYIIKLFNKNITSEKLIRFKNEINFGKFHKHKNIISIIDNGLKTDGDKEYMFYVMPKYKDDLRFLMKQEIKGGKILEYFNQILEGIKFVHNKGAFHRDLKPENILWDEKEDLLIITDFGIAHFHEEDLIDNPQTRKIDKLANFQYAAPEQRMRARNVDKRCDIYALGLILNELFTSEIVQGTKYKEIKDVDENFAFLDPIVEKMIAQNPNERYSSIEEIQNEINARIQINNINKRNNELKKINIKDEEIDYEPIKIIDVSFDETELRIIFNKKPDTLWKELILQIDRRAVIGYEPEKFKFLGEEAILVKSYLNMNSIPQIVECFKSWVESVNKIYPERMKKIIEEKRRNKENQIRAEIERNEKMNEIRKLIKL